METPGLELTRAELESLFDIVDENGGDAQRSSNDSKSGSKSGDSAVSPPSGVGPKHVTGGGCRQERVLTSDSSLLLFLRRCGLRRSERGYKTVVVSAINKPKRGDGNDSCSFMYLLCQTQI